MGSKKKFFEPIMGIEINRAIDLSKSIPEKLNNFQEDIRYLDSNQLFHKQFTHQLLAIINNLEELNHLLLVMTKPKDIYYSLLRTALAAVSNISNSLIITAYYLDSENKYKRLLNKNTFSFELNLILKKLDFVKQILERVSKGNSSNRGIQRPISDFRSRA
ncbi:MULTISPECIES: hypothetical protein [Acinetobacter]|uniref:hypothetical protein n=1 Tax=Acinetobacter TaxID=469 RepID=UPI0001B8E663|nr:MULTISPECIES: hypothetical protein [Acinetobacter]EEX01572.1 hypothetical protein HMPREF0014_00169 [Acinetobacter sp. RUH 2624]MBR7739531.1 hypothetical protein [Acinetobacter nosocomialis]MBZ6534620.1 hypothetical protein [Acinetobacter seifertii]QNY07061.1 hypothetical protein IC769_03770 [Acinetobacter seifertii]QNY17894.1 hypothetical protein IC765_03870 [Acinetobacter seifertii]